MAAMGDYLEGKVLDAIFRGQAFPTFASVYLALLTSASSDAGGGTEVSGGSYARIKCSAGSTQALTDWKSTQGNDVASTGNTGQTTNSVTFTFAAPSAAWGTITSFEVRDALTGGNLLFYGTLSTPKNVAAGDAAPSFPPGSLVVQVDN